jgi:hypothetical protein
MTTYVNGLSRLKLLPEVFSVNTMSRALGFSKPAALNYLARWKARSWVVPAGPRAGMYFNLVVNPTAANDCITTALKMIYPSATLTGESVLHAAGWISQIPQLLHVAVERRRSYVQLNGFELHPRDNDWFIAVKLQSAAKAKFATHGLRTLTPSWALADLYAHPHEWQPDDDDLDIPADYQREVDKATAKIGKVIGDPS